MIVIRIVAFSLDAIHILVFSLAAVIEKRGKEKRKKKNQTYSAVTESYFTCLYTKVYLV